MGFDVVVLAGEHGRLKGPLSVKIPQAIKEGISVILEGEINESEEVKIEGYLESYSKKESILTFIVPDLKKRDELELSFEVQNTETTPNVKLEKKDEHNIDILIKGEYFSTLTYNPPEELANRPFLYPLMAPSKVGVTRNYPIKKVEGETSDHVHHTSCWTAWGDINGVDNWAYGKSKGKQITDSIKLLETPSFGKITMENFWTDKKGHNQLKENRTITVYNMDDIRMVDFIIKFKSLIGDIKFKDTKEGGFLSIRVATSMDGSRGGKIENSIGAVSEKETWGKRAEWCDYSGIVEGKKVGVAIFDNYDNVNFPTYWHVRDYGLMAANPFGLSHFIGKNKDGTYILNAKDELIFKYRLVVHDGDAFEAKLKEHYLNYYVPWETHVFKN